MGMTDSWLRRTRCRNGGGLRSWLALSVLLPAGCLAAEWAASRERLNVEQRLEGFAPTYAAELSRLGHARLRLDAPPDDPLYLSLIDAQKRWLAMNPAVSDIYSFRRSPDGRVVFVVDSETDHDRDGAYEGEQEQRTAPGESYDPGTSSPNHPLMRAFEGNRTFDGEPYADRWGTWVSAYAPMYAEDGAVEAVLGVDYPAGGWVTAIAWSRAAALGFVSIMIVTLIGSTTSVTLVRAELARREETEALLRRAATHDKLTGLPNRALLMSRLNTVVRRTAEPSRHAQSFALLFLDFDRFKFINDTLGHEAGDRLLVSIAGRLCDVCDAWNQDHGPMCDLMCARMGGDEFVLVASGLLDLNKILMLTDAVRKALAPPHWVCEQDVRSTPSIGVTTSAHGYTRAEDVVRDADAAMYQAKAAGRNCVAMFDVSMREAAVARVTLENDLRQALQEREITLVYQPIMRLGAGGVCGVEALARWKSPTRGDVPAAEFIGLAEEAGLITALGEIVLRNALLQSIAWRNVPGIPNDLTVSVNISRVQLQSDELVRTAERLLWETGADARGIVLEITESAIMDDPDVAARAIASLRGMGFQLYMDDFGTGHSSLSLLHRFQLDGLKIDRSFIATVCERRDYAAIVHAVVSLAHKLNMRLVAEGIETAHQMALLQALECDFGQGFYFARPMGADAVPAAIADLSAGRVDGPQSRAA
jgi:diguanylate cyclase (GGDEF)-like protein